MASVASHARWIVASSPRAAAARITNHMASIPWPGVNCRPTSVSGCVPSGATFSKITPRPGSRKSVMISRMHESMTASVAESSRADPSTWATLRLIIGIARLFSAGASGRRLSYRPLGRSLRAWMRSKVLQAMSIASSSPAARPYSANAMTAKKSLKILYGATIGSPCRLSAKYQSPFSSRPCFFRNAAPSRAASSHSTGPSSARYSMEKVQTSRFCGHMYLSVSKTDPSKSSWCRYPPHSRSSEWRSQKGTQSSRRAVR